MPKLYLIFLSLLFSGTAFSQTYIEPLAGYQIDAKNPKTIKQFVAGFQFAWKHSDKYEPVLQFHAGLPVAYKSTDSSFTLNPALPLNAPAAKTIKPISFAGAFIQRIKLGRFAKVNKISFLVNTGLTYQKLKVNYQYDKGNYVILNPDRTQTKFGLYLGMGLEYMRELPQGRIFVQYNIDLPPISKRNKYPTGFKSIQPTGVRLGYSLPLKTKHEK